MNAQEVHGGGCRGVTGRSQQALERVFCFVSPFLSLAGEQFLRKSSTIATLGGQEWRPLDRSNDGRLFYILCTPPRLSPATFSRVIPEGTSTFASSIHFHSSVATTDVPSTDAIGSCSWDWTCERIWPRNFPKSIADYWRLYQRNLTIS